MVVLNGCPITPGHHYGDCITKGGVTQQPKSVAAEAQTQENGMKATDVYRDRLDAGQVPHISGAQPPVDTHIPLRALSDPRRYLLRQPGKARGLMTSRRLAPPQASRGWQQGSQGR